MKRSKCVLSVLALAAVAAAQESSLGSPVGLALSDLEIPVHATPDGEVWAVRGDYKVSFHDGVAFHPRRGEREATPLHWRVTGIRMAGQDLAADMDRTEPSFTEWRVEYQHGAVVEAYDILAEGVEQTFVLARDPGLDGDLVVEGTISTPLSSAPVSDRHGPLAFRDGAGATMVEYGAAWAIDAGGDRVDVNTSWDGDMVRLTVPRAWLANASYPVTLDPLWTPVGVEDAGFLWGGAGRPEVINVSQGMTNTTLLFFSRPWSGSDWDCFAYTCDSSFGNALRVYSDVSSGVASRNVACSFVGATQRWVLAHDQQSVGTLTSSYVRVAHLAFDNTGTVQIRDFFAIEPGNMLLFPDVGGSVESSTTGDNALMVCMEINPFSGSWANGYLLDTRTNTYLGSPVLDQDNLAPFEQRAYPAINQLSLGGSAHWMVVFQHRTDATALWTMRGSLISAIGVNVGSAAFGTPSTKNAIRPRVAGDQGVYLLSYVLSNDPVGDFGDQVHTERFDWDDGLSAPTLIDRNLIANASGANNYRNSDLAHDRLYVGMWGMTWEGKSGANPRVEVARIGATGAAVEWQLVATNAIAPAITLERIQHRFVLAYSSTASPLTVFAQRFSKDPAAQNVVYGSSCGARIFSPWFPAAGFAGYQVWMDQAPASQAAWLLLGQSQSGIPLNGIGMPGCSLNVGLIRANVPAVTDATGKVGINIPLPDDPLVFGDFYTQWFYLGASNLRGMGSTEGMRVQVR